MPVDYDILFHRTSFDFAKNNVVAPKQFRDISEYLKRPYPNEIILIPFGGTDLCGQNDYGIISQYSGVFVRNNYFTNFLLSEKLEKDYNNQLLWWKDVKTFGDQLKKLRANEYIIFNNDQEKLFMKQIDKYNLFFPLGKINLVTSSIMEFTNFGLYH